jgi:hypothetical protein
MSERYLDIHKWPQQPIASTELPCTRPLMPARLMILGLLFFLPTAAGAASCNSTSQAGVKCSCDARTLRPLQGAIGMEEVREKMKKIAAKPKKERQDLADDPIKVIRGPGGALFITDHHHGADAWRLAGHPRVLCQIGDRPPFTTDAEFWSGLIDDHLVHLADANGKPLKPEQLPSKLKLMPDDPYRSLAWRLRKADGFCRSEKQKEFVEFTWADRLRAQPGLPIDAVRGSTIDVLPAALEFARSPAAQDLPGYVGDKPSGFKCPKDQ